MNTDKIYAESLVNEYSKKATSKVVALRKLDKRQKHHQIFLLIHLVLFLH